MNYVTHRTSFAWELASTAGTALVGMLGLLVMTRWLALGLGPEEFGAFATGRRLALFLMPLITCSIALSLTRTVAASRHHPVKLHSLLAVATVFALSVLLVLVTIAFLGNSPLSTLLFSTHAHSQLLLASVVYLTMLTLHSIWIAYLRGIGAIHQSNAWTILLLIAQLGFAWVSGDGHAHTFLFLAGLLIVPHLLAITQVVRGSLLDMTWTDSWHSLQTLVRFGWLRAPSTILLDSVALLTQILVAHLHGFAASVPFALAYMLMRIADGFVNPISITLLSRTQSVVTHMTSPLWTPRITAVLEMFTDLPVFLTFQCLVWFPTLVEAWLGPAYLTGVLLCQLTILGLIPYTWALLSRGLLDAIDPYPWATRYLGIALGLTALTTPLLFGVLPLEYALAIGSTLLFATFGSLLWHHLHHRFQVPQFTQRAGNVIVMNLLLAVLAGTVTHIVATMPLTIRITVAVVTTLILGAGYLHWGLPPRTMWPQFLLHMWHSRRQQT